MNMGVPILLERDNVNDDVVVLSHWFVKDGEMVEPGRLIAEIETSKANVEVLAPEAGYLYWRFIENEEISLSEPIGHILPEPVPVGSLLVSSPKSLNASSEQGSTSILSPVAVIDVPRPVESTIRLLVTGGRRPVSSFLLRRGTLSRSLAVRKN